MLRAPVYTLHEINRLKLLLVFHEIILILQCVSGSLIFRLYQSQLSNFLSFAYINRFLSDPALKLQLSLLFRRKEGNFNQNYNNMYAESLDNRKCNDCGLSFQSPYELQNHKRRFCLNSGYDNLEGLAKIQFHGAAPTHQPAFSHKNYLKQCGANSLTKIGQYDQFTASNVEKDMHNIHRFKRQLDGAQKYKHNAKAQQQFAESEAKLNQSRFTQNSYSESRLEEELKRYEKPVKEEAISPPTFIDQLNMRNHTMLDKSNSTLARMPKKEKIQYAKIKLDELNEIKALYVQNGGQKNEFKANIDRMVQFYQNFLNQQIKKQKEEENKGFNDSQTLIQSRCSTPILKLRDFNQVLKQSQNQSAVKKVQNVSQVKPNNSKTQTNMQMNNPNYPIYPQSGGTGYPYSQPPVIMIPYPQQNQPTPNDSMRLLEKMIQLKSEENQKLLDILMYDRKKPSQSTPTYIPFPQQFSQLPMNPQVSNSPKKEETKKNRKGCIDVSQDYQFKKSMIDDLISQEKVLLALQQEELDQLKLLSQLPKQLQEIKIKSTIKSSDTRFQIQKQILKQKMARMAFQEQNQTFEEQRKLTNDRWAGEERKKLLEKQLDRYVDNFANQFVENDEDG